MNGLLNDWTYLNGIYTPVITPFNENNKVDPVGLRESIGFLVDSGVHGICISCGTGEEAFLSREERKLNLRIALEVVENKIPVVAGTGYGTFSTAETLEHIEDAKEIGADAQLLGIQARASDRGIYNYFTEAAQLGLPIILYSLPYERGARPITPLMVQKLLDFDSKTFIGIKECIDSTLATCIQLNSSRTSVFTGNDNYLIQAFLLGAQGAISTISNVAPNLVVDIYDNVKNGDLSLAKESYYQLLPLIELIESIRSRENYVANNTTMTKYLCECLGRPGGKPRKPQEPLTENLKKQARDSLKAAKLL